jgi:hypothetical protein
MTKHNTPRRAAKTIAVGTMARKDVGFASRVGRKKTGKRFASKAARRADKALCRNERD